MIGLQSRTYIRYVPRMHEKDNIMANITITCTDNVKSRMDLWKVLKAVPESDYTNHLAHRYVARLWKLAVKRTGCNGNRPENQAAGIASL